MDSEADFRELIILIEPLSVSEQREILLGYFNGILRGLTATDIVGLRAHLLAVFPRGPVQETMTEVLDGHLTLREISPE